MNLIVCLDDRNGMSFAGRRQSMDSLLRQQMLRLVGNCVLRMNAYSAEQFAEQAQNISVSEDFLAQAGEDDFCFVENVDVIPLIPKVKQLIIYRWNRAYPYDTALPTALTGHNWKKTESLDFQGHSHNRITQEVYIRCS